MRPELEIIGLKPGDAVVGAASAPDGAELVFVTSDAQLLRFAAAAVRPQGAPAGGMAGINLVGGRQSSSISGSSTGEDVVAVTISGADGVLPGTDAGRVKVSRFEEFPAKGRATGGVRAHALPARREPAHAGLGRARTRAGRRSRRIDAHAACGDRQARRLRSAARRRDRLDRARSRLKPWHVAEGVQPCSRSRASSREVPRLLTRPPTTSRRARPLSSSLVSAAWARVCCSTR